MKPAPVRVRLAASYALVLAVLLTALGVFVVTRLRADLVAEVDRDLTAIADRIVEAYRSEGPIEFSEATREFLSRRDVRSSGAQVVDPTGRIVTSAGGPIVASTLLPVAKIEAIIATGRQIDSVTLAGEEHLRVVGTAVARKDRTFVVVTADSLHGVDEAVGRVVLLMTIGGVAALLLACAGGWWVAGRGLRPVTEMSERARMIDVSGLAERVPVPAADDEFRDLALTLNGMLSRLERGVATRERLVADASHELRAPLAAMRAELEVSMRVDALSSASRAGLASLHDETLRMGRIVDNLLTLARVDDGKLDLALDIVDVKDVAGDAVATFAAAATLADVRMVVQGAAAWVRGDRERLRLLITNLLDNAMRVSPPGGAVVVQVTKGDDHVTLSVRDDGPGVPEHERHRVFERFARADPARSRAGGAGLGLAICYEIARAHGGAISVDRAEGGGALFTVTLPMAG